ncbi:MAG: hypothetical protein IPP91_10640 [Betaproteobacteria bacterium]|nr:hypothetical protein [Betaproteobacteria bacterium]
MRSAIGLLAALAVAISSSPGLSLAALSVEEKAALATPPVAKGQEHGDAALRMARRLGEEKRVDGLEAIVAMRAPRLVNLWRDGLGGSTLANEHGQELPREVAVVEAAVLAQLARSKPDARMTEALSQIFNAIRWRSRPAFDLLKARAIGPVWPPETRFLPLLNTANPEFGEPLFALREAMPSSVRPTFLATLARLKVTAAHPFIEEVLLTRPPGELFVTDLSRALLALDERLPPPAMLARIRQDLERPAESSALQDAVILLGAIADDKSGRPLDYRALRASLGDPVPEPLRPGLVRTIQSHRVAEGRDDLVALVAVGGAGADYAASAVVAIPDPDLWKRTLEAARATKAREPGNQRLDYPITQLEKNVAQGSAGAETMKREAESREAVGRISLASQRVTRLLMGTDVSAEAAAELEESLAQWSKRIDEAGADGRIHETIYREGRHSAALWYRFRHGNPRKALAEFDRLAQEGMLESAVAAADTLQHDLGDPKGALARWESLLARRRAAKDAVWTRGNGTVGENWVRQWIEAEIANLKGGKRFGGSVTLESAQSAGSAVFILGLGMPWRQGLFYSYEPARGKQFLAEIRAARPNRFALLTLYSLLAQPDTGDLSADLLRNDPTGFLAAQFVGNLLAYRDPGREARAKPLAPEQLEAARGATAATAAGLSKATRVGFRLEPDPTYATPTKTWEVFLAALRKGDRAAAGACLTPNVLEKWAPILEKLSTADMKKMADTVRSFAPAMQLEAHAEYAVDREGGTGGIVSFAKHYGEWKIAQM